MHPRETLLWRSPEPPTLQSVSVCMSHKQRLKQVGLGAALMDDTLCLNPSLFCSCNAVSRKAMCILIYGGRLERFRLRGCQSCSVHQK